MIMQPQPAVNHTFSYQMATAESSPFAFMPPSPCAAQVLSWDQSVTRRSPVAAALHSLFKSLAAAAERQHGAGGAGGAPVALNPAVLREALASLPGQQFQLGKCSWVLPGERGHYFRHQVPATHCGGECHVMPCA